MLRGRAAARKRGETAEADAIDVDLLVDVIAGTVVQRLLVSAEPVDETWVRAFTTFVLGGLAAAT